MKEFDIPDKELLLQKLSEINAKLLEINEIINELID